MTRSLVVEDDPSVGAAIVMTLGHEGYDTVHAPDAAIGMRAVESSRFELAIIDIFQPDASGLGTIAELRRKSPAIPILAISGFVFRESMDPRSGLSGLGHQSRRGCLPEKTFASRQLTAAVRASLAPAILTMTF
jgi:DNA-binding response OmpR family regulator